MQVQLDIFLHNRDLMLRNDVIAALRSRDRTAGLRTLTLLATEFPGDSLLAPLEILLNTLGAPVERFLDHGDTANAILDVDTVVTPAANQVFGDKEARAWLAPVWQAIANSASGLPYNVEAPHTHAASIYLRGGDWAAAQIQVAAISSWHRIPATLAWMAEASVGQGGLDNAWCLLVELAWIDPARFGALARQLKSEILLQNLLDDFDGNFKSEDQTYLAWFPAFVLIENPSLAAVLRKARACSNTDPERTARLVMELLALERQGRHKDLVAQRKKLRDLHAGLFSRYMLTR